MLPGAVRRPGCPRLQFAPETRTEGGASMTATQVNERELRRRDAILEAARLATERFLSDTANWVAELPLVLETLGKAAEVSRVFVSTNFEDDAGELYSRQIDEWNADGVV